MAFQSSKGNKHSKKGKLSKKHVECFNCHKLGHIQHECQAPGRGKEGQPLPQRKDKGKNMDNLANTENATHDSVWSTTTTLTPDIIEGHSALLVTPPHPHQSIYLKEMPDENMASTYAANATTTPPGTMSKLYDSGAACHMTPHKDLLSNYVSIVPKPINSTNQLTFQEIRHRDLTIHMPNNGHTSNIMLWDVLYALDISITLVSIGLIDEVSYSMTLQGGMCTICNKHNCIIGAIPRHDGLYCVDTTRATIVSAVTPNKKLTIMEAH